jgi:hypothetical protein
MTTEAIVWHLVSDEKAAEQVYVSDTISVWRAGYYFTGDRLVWLPDEPMASVPCHLGGPRT